MLLTAGSEFFFLYTNIFFLFSLPSPDASWGTFIHLSSHRCVETQTPPYNKHNTEQLRGSAVFTVVVLRGLSRSIMYLESDQS